jgi:hypothetical protein
MGQAKRRKQALGTLYGTPLGSNRLTEPPRTLNLESSLEILSTYLSEADQRDAVLALRDGPALFERRYKPLPEHAETVAAVTVTCNGMTAVVGLIPHPPA